MKILIVDDDTICRWSLQTAIEKNGHQAIVAEDGAQAWKFYDKEPARLVISDWLMPELDGLALCRKIRARPETDYTYFIMLTIRSGSGNYREAIEAGVDDFLSKPLEREELTARLRVAERILSYTTQIKRLHSLLPICMYCKKIRDDKDYWHQIEEYIHTSTGTDFSHSICPACYEKHVRPQLETVRRKTPGQTK
ncbi:MAG: response regulator [Verrucomicrobiae bacterium]|nr:response regulator [Verrucomicrobiae bacterium]